MSFAVINPKRLAKINNPQYIETKLYITYSIFFMLFMFLGAITCHLFKHIIPSDVCNGMASLFIVSKPEDSIIKIISSIIYNTLDIFKISIIIILSGFSYIARFVCRTTAAIWSIWCGCTVFYCIHIAEEPAININLIILIIITTLLYCLVFIYNCVKAELASRELSMPRNSMQLFSSGAFWKYVENFLISFGYILMIYTAYMFLFNLLK